MQTEAKRDTRKVEPIDSRYLGQLYRQSENRGEGAKRVLRFVRHAIRPKEEGGKGYAPESFSFRGLALALGVIDPYDQEGSLRTAMAESACSTERRTVESMLTESNPGVNTNAFQIITGELIADAAIEGYEDDSDFIGDRLVMTMPNQRLRDQRIAGMTALAGPKEVKEGHPYEESGFEEKYVTTKEAKKGRILSINEELILFDQTSMILMHARDLGFYTRQERERTIVRAVTEADATNEPVYRPNGTAATLYAADGSNYNWIGAGNTTSASFASAVALEDYTDLNTVYQYRATEVKDDRIDGTARHIAGLNGPRNILLVSQTKLSTANFVVNQQFTQINPGATSGNSTRNGNPILLSVDGSRLLSSPYIDEQGGQAVNDWFYGDFMRQFIWTEIWPIQTFVQAANSEAQYERDVAFRVKIRYYGGCSAKDTKWVTKVDGAA